MVESWIWGNLKDEKANFREARSMKIKATSYDLKSIFENRLTLLWIILKFVYPQFDWDIPAFLVKDEFEIVDS